MPDPLPWPANGDRPEPSEPDGPPPPDYLVFGSAAPRRPFRRVQRPGLTAPQHKRRPHRTVRLHRTAPPR
jgi:hypothetical protein